MTAACSHGAFYSDADDEKRTRQFAAQLTREHWQFYDKATRASTTKKRDKLAITEKDSIGDDENRRRTRRVDGACIFLNRPGFAGGAGCFAASARNAHRPQSARDQARGLLAAARPPVRRTGSKRPDETKILVSTVTEFDRRGWGEGGADMHWLLHLVHPRRTSAPTRCTCPYGPELIALIGAKAYDELARLCAQRLELGLVAAHPATVPRARTQAGREVVQPLARSGGRAGWLARR